MPPKRKQVTRVNDLAIRKAIGKAQLVLGSDSEQAELRKEVVESMKRFDENVRRFNENYARGMEIFRKAKLIKRFDQ